MFARLTAAFVALVAVTGAVANDDTGTPTCTNVCCQTAAITPRGWSGTNCWEAPAELPCAFNMCCYEVGDQGDSAGSRSMAAMRIVMRTWVVVLRSSMTTGFKWSLAPRWAETRALDQPCSFGVEWSWIQHDVMTGLGPAKRFSLSALPSLAARLYPLLRCIFSYEAPNDARARAPPRPALLSITRVYIRHGSWFCRTDVVCKMVQARVLCSLFKWWARQDSGAYAGAP
ncbi:hypothetical protein HD554DRAFT_2042771 [Boletus coccyginus]|nr:hypothetical protein HD554DRAFT_2042771 [Boletus coccyginus]